MLICSRKDPMDSILDRNKSTLNASNTNRRRKEDLFTASYETVESLMSKVKQQTDDISIKEEQLMQVVNKQKRSEEQIHIRTKAMDAVVDGIFIIDALNPNFPLIYANQSYCKMSGYLKGEIIGKNYFLHYGPFTDPRFLEEIKHTLVHGKSFFGEMLQFRKNGEKYWNLLHITLVGDGSGTITH